MLSYGFNMQTIKNLSCAINKVTLSLLSISTTKSYPGNCPFLRGISTIRDGSSLPSFSISEESSPDKIDPESSESKVFFADSYLAQQCPKLHSIYNGESGHQAASIVIDSSTGDAAGTVDKQVDEQLCRSTLLKETQPVEGPGTQSSDGEQQCATGGQHQLQHQTPIKMYNNYNYDKLLESLLRRKKEDGSYRVFRKVRRFSSNFPHGTDENLPVTIWCSNDYFGMSSHPKVCQAIREALEKYGAGSGGTRNIAGNSPVHEELEWELADLHEKEAALLFSSCYVANDSTLFTLLKLIPNCHIFSDAGNHASMIQGIRNSAAPKHIFRSFDALDLEEKLKQVPLGTPKIVAFETVHSMSGDISQVEELCDVSHKYGALTFVDEVHAVGLYGERGAGIGQRDKCLDKIDVVSGTLGKAFGNFGGYIAGPVNLVDVVRSYASGFIFTTSLPPTVACGATESVRILKGPEGRYLREMQQNNVLYMKRALLAAGLPHYSSKSHIIPIPVADPTKCNQVSRDLLQLGHYIQSINYPTVSRGSERLRVSISPFHSPKMIDSLIQNLLSVWNNNKLELIHQNVELDECSAIQN